jgi:molybdopterin synthase sulfur carrier subunit
MPVLRKGNDMKILYFAWVRQKTGIAEEDVQPPAEVATVADLIEWLRGRGPEFAHAFEDLRVIRAAVDQVHAQPGTAIGDAREIAFFPPVTGG